MQQGSDVPHIKGLVARSGTVMDAVAAAHSSLYASARGTQACLAAESIVGIAASEHDVSASLALVGALDRTARLVPNS